MSPSNRAPIVDPANSSSPAIFVMSMIRPFPSIAGSGRGRPVEVRGPALAEGTIFGALIGLFVVGAFVLHNYVNLNIGLKLTAISAVAYFVEWCVVGIVIGLVYKPLRA